MAEAHLQTVLRHVRLLAAAPRDGGPSDGELLRAFSRRRDEDAFAALVRRHGAMVLGVCRRVLHHRQDAEDAFQATFLILARKAARLREQTTLAAWLYGSAYRAALSVRRAAARRRAHEGRVPTRPCEDLVTGLSWREVQGLLEEEIQRLPEPYRMAFVLCCMEGQDRAEAARRLGLKEGTLSSRLDQAKKRLRRRLSSRGVTLAAVLAASALAHEAGATTVPASLFGTTARAAAVPGTSVPARVAALVEGGLRATSLTRLAIGASLALVLGLVAGVGGFVARQAPAAEAPDAGEQARPPEPAAEEVPLRADRNGDPLPAGALLRLGTVRFRHGSMVTGLAFAPDGKAIVSCSYDRTLRLWDMATGRELKRFSDSGGSFSALCASADGKTIAARTYTGELRSYDVLGGRLDKLTGNLDFGRAGIALAPDGKTLATLLGTKVNLIDLANQKALGGPWDGHKTKATAVAYSPDGKSLASGEEDGTVLLRDAATGAVSLQLEGKRPVFAVAISPDGQTLAAGGGGRANEEKLCLWDVSSGKLLRELGSHFPAVDSITFSPDGKVLASAGSRGQLYQWDAATGKELCRVWAYAEAIAFSPDGKLLASAGNDCTIRFWEVPTGKERAAPADGHRGSVQTIAVSKDGAVVATAGVGESSIRLWDTASGKELRRIDAASTWFGGRGAMALSPDGKAVATDLGIWDTATGKFLLPRDGKRTAFRGQDYSIEAIAYAPDGKTLAMGTRDTQSGRERTIRLWDAATALERGHFGTQEVRALAYSPDGKLLAAGNQDGTVGLWDVATGRELHRIAGHSRDVNSVAFSPDGKVVASCTFDGDIGLWDTATGKSVGHLGHTGNPGHENVFAIAFAPNGKALAAAGSPDLSREGTCINLWELATERVRLRLAGHQGDVNAVAFAGGSRFLVSGSGDSTALVWDLLVSPRPAPTRAELDGLRNDLLGNDAERAYGAACRLAKSPAGVKSLGEHLPPAAPPPDADRVTRLVKGLDSDDFAERQKASQELAQLGESAEPLLRKALAGQPSAEVRRRVSEALDKLSPEGLRTERAVEALELAGTAEARQVLEAIAQGAPGTRRTREAQAALERLRGPSLRQPGP